MVAIATIAVIITTTITHSVDSYIQWMDPDVRRVTGGFKDHLVSVCLLLHREREHSPFRRPFSFNGVAEIFPLNREKKLK